ncbi:uncharacterized protein XM38_001750 [Halomicronema hongdechloris C2206]|uniref:Uncharacterized protein n=1 Tax=Halomicronema hongdechloris C2206 TaxID=1641165 RepID=A0A1Z3HG50_9CYAN|nr:uncharacterized protein XM38_001750 [Halomicronema hongdechloris C2206]
MGLIKKIFGALFSLIGGVFSLIGGILRAIGGLVGLGKKAEYYVELDQASSGSQPPSSTKSGNAEAETAQAAPQMAAVASSSSLSSTSSAKGTATTVKTGAKPQASAPKPSTAASSAPEPTGNFATEYLVNPRLNNNSRRRPGPSLSAYKDLARQVKAPS